MLEPVTIDQDHFRVPTLRTDSRGLVIGDRGMLRFSILPQVVSFFQAFTEEQSLDHVASSLRLLKIRSRTTGIEFLVDIPSQGSYLLDRAAQITRLLGGSAYTGNWPHFVPYRDRQSPFGYDAKELITHSDGPIFYGQHGAQRFELDGELSFEALLLDLSLQRVDSPETARCTLKVREGLRRAMQSFLWRRKIKASVSRVIRVAEGKFDRAEVEWLFRIAETPHRLYALFTNMPGVEVYHSFGKNLYVERGWAHPFAIENCRRFFNDDRLYFFCGSRDTVDRVDGDALTWVELASMNAQNFRLSVLEEVRSTQNLSGNPDAVYRGQPIGEAIEYEVSVVEVPEAVAEHVSAVLITDMTEIRWLKRLVFSLPRSALEGYRAAFTDQGILVTNPDGVEWLPLGIGLKEVFPNVYLPAGLRFSPPIGYQHLAAALNMERGNVYVIPHEINHPTEIPETWLKPLVKYLLADVQLVHPHDKSPEPQHDPEDGIPFKSREAGLFSLWMQNLLKPGLTDKKKALPTEPSPSGSQPQATRTREPSTSGSADSQLGNAPLDGAETIKMDAVPPRHDPDSNED